MADAERTRTLPPPPSPGAGPAGGPAAAAPAAAAARLPGRRGRAGPADRAVAAPPAEAPWRIRVVGHDLVAPGDLINHPDNFRGHPPAQRQALLAAVDEHGFLGEVLVSRRSGRILDGHLRVAEAVRTGQAVVPVGWVDCRSDEDEAAILATYDPIGALATTDRQRLGDLVARAHINSDALKTMLTVLATTPIRTTGTGAGTGGGGRGGHLGQVGDLVHPVVVECDDAGSAEALLELLAEEGHVAYLLPPSPSAVGDPP